MSNESFVFCAENLWLDKKITIHDSGILAGCAFRKNMIQV